ncbi:insulin-induced protein [Podospora didyma]|uniref:Insulin-induced protein n=1 Tax=Podospora didyma TaxID=330526 RepID=A0AAE0KDU1_9PEZI|nr:insulin-induced protein [Podospora didyma]
MDSPSSPRPGSADGGPEILRPIPRRPFNLNFTSPTPPNDDDSSPSTPHITANDLRFLDPRHQQQQDANTLSRATSLLNLTSSTLFGIYSPTSRGGDQERDYELSTPWGTGAETPAIGSDSRLDDKTYELIKERRSGMQPRRGGQTSLSYFDQPLSSSPMAAGGAPSSSAATTAWSLIIRAVLLFALGMGYGVLVTRLPNRQNLSAFGVDHQQDTNHLGGGGGEGGGNTYDWRYLGFWGAAGVALGSLLPWFDRVWEDTFAASPQGSSGLGGRPEADWALVVRGIGAFVGIVFAIRRLPWTSTMQVSLTLALANPFLWYLIDRSKPGFLLSAAVGLTGSAILMGLNPDMMPAPTAGLHHGGGAAGSLLANGTAVAGARQRAAAALGGFASQETIETGIWMLSVLFCSCVCFGNIGRRLALNRSAADRGRWGGVR